jgi:hypothetical protein
MANPSQAAKAALDAAKAVQQKLDAAAQAIGKTALYTGVVGHNTVAQIPSMKEYNASLSLKSNVAASTLKAYDAVSNNHFATAAQFAYKISGKQMATRLPKNEAAQINAALAIDTKLTTAQKSFEAEMQALNADIKQPNASGPLLFDRFLTAANKFETAVQAQQKKETTAMEALFDRTKNPTFTQNLVAKGIDVDDLKVNMLKELEEKHKKQTEEVKKSLDATRDKWQKDIAAEQARMELLLSAYGTKKGRAAIDEAIRQKNGGVTINFGDTSTDLKGLNPDDLTYLATVNGTQISKNEDGSYSLTRSLFDTIFYSDEKRRGDYLSVIQAIRASGKENVTMTFNNQEFPENAENAARIAYEAAREAGYPEDKITININGREYKADKDSKGENTIQKGLFGDKHTAQYNKAEASAKNAAKIREARWSELLAANKAAQQPKTTPPGVPAPQGTGGNAAPHAGAGAQTQTPPGAGLPPAQSGTGATHATYPTAGQQPAHPGTGAQHATQSPAGQQPAHPGTGAQHATQSPAGQQPAHPGTVAQHATQSPAGQQPAHPGTVAQHATQSSAGQQPAHPGTGAQHATQSSAGQQPAHPGTVAQHATQSSAGQQPAHPGTGAQHATQSPAAHPAAGAQHASAPPAASAPSNPSAAGKPPANTTAQLGTPPASAVAKQSLAAIHPCAPVAPAAGGASLAAPSNSSAPTPFSGSPTPQGG